MCLISLFLFAYGAGTVWAIRYIKINAGKKDTLWLVPFVMLIVSLAFKIAAHNESKIPAMTGAPELFTFVGETFFDAMAVLWSALLGAVFLTGTKSTAKTLPVDPGDGISQQPDEGAAAEGKASSANSDDPIPQQPDEREAAGTNSQEHSAKGEAADEAALMAGPQQDSSGSEGAGGMTTFSQLLDKFRDARPAAASAPLRWKELLTVPGVLLLAVLLLIALPADWRGSGWVRAIALVTVLACYLYGLWLLVLPLRTLADPVPEMMRELDRRFEQESSLRVHLQDVSVEQRRWMSARLERYVRLLLGASKVSQLTFVLSPFFAFSLELVSQGGLSSLQRGPLLIVGALLFGALIGIMQLRRALVELESLQLSLAEMPVGEGSQRS